MPKKLFVAVTCAVCGHRFEVQAGSAEARRPVCSSCGHAGYLEPADVAPDQEDPPTF